MAMNAIGMRRMILGEGSFVESVLGRITLVALFTSVVGLVLFLLFLVNDLVPPVVLKYALVATLGLAAGFASRRLLAGRNIFLKLVSSLLGLFIALGVLNVASRGFIGLNLLRAYPSISSWDGVVSFGLSAVFAWLALAAWAGPLREVIVEPRYVPAPEPAPRPARRTTSRPRRSSARLSTSPLAVSFTAWRERTAAQLSSLLPATGGTTTRRKKARKATKLKAKPARAARRRLPAVYLSAEEEHLCPYCLEAVVKNDRRGVKICKVCKTWHHADCWAITGVCQVPHQYVN